MTPTYKGKTNGRFLKRGNYFQVLKELSTQNPILGKNILQEWRRNQGIFMKTKRICCHKTYPERTANTKETQREWQKKKTDFGTSGMKKSGMQKYGTYERLSFPLLIFLYCTSRSQRYKNMVWYGFNVCRGNISII